MFVGTTVQASTIGLEVQALGSVVRVLNRWGPLGAVLAELGGQLAGCRGLAWLLLLRDTIAGLHLLLGRLVVLIFTLLVGLLKLLEELFLTVLVLFDQDRSDVSFW